MPSIYYKRNFVAGYYYHIYNRGANKNRVFKDKEDYLTFTDILAYYLQYPSGKPRSYLELLKVRNLKENTILPTSINLAAYT